MEILVMNMSNDHRTTKFSTGCTYEAPHAEVVDVEPFAVLCASSGGGGSKGNNNGKNEYGFI